MSETRSRIISATIALPVVVLFVLLDHWVVDTVFYLLAVIFLTKELSLLSPRLHSMERQYTLFFSIVTAIMQLFCLQFPEKYLIRMDQVVIYSLVLLIAMFFLIHIFKNDFNDLYEKVQSMVFIVFFSNFFLSFFLKLKYLSLYFSDRLDLQYLDEVDNFYFLFPLALAWIYDSMAYFGGKFLGKKKLGMAVSPNKTWMGLFIGLFSAPLSFILVGELVKLKSLDLYEVSFFSNLQWGIPLSVLLALLAQFGDLMGSLIKRSVGIKNSGEFLKGHGGFLDRLDSLLPTTLVFYYLLVITY